jgi:hypothetical protein
VVRIRERLPRLASVQFAHEALDAFVAAWEAALIDQVPPDGHGVATAGQAQLDRFAVGIADAGYGGAA